MQPGLIHPERVDDSWRHRKDRLDPRIGDVERGGGIER
jgi:hypothetical protein